MAQCGSVDKVSIFLFLLAILPTISSQKNNNTTTPVTPSPSINSTSLPIKTTSTQSINNTTPVLSSHIQPTTTFNPTTSTHHVSPTPTNTVTPTASITPSPTVMPSSRSINVTTTPSPRPTTHPHPHSTKDCHNCKEQLAAQKRYKYVSVAFNIIFALALIVMTIMYLRQRKMYREMEGDGSLSRLI